MRRHPIPGVLSAALTLGVLSIACGDGADVPRLIEETAADACLPFDDHDRIEAILGGDWRIGMPSAVSALTDCEDPAFDGRMVVSAPGGVVHHEPLSDLVIETFPPIFLMDGNEDGGRHRFSAEIGAAHCGGRVWIWNQNERLWFLCSGPLDPVARRIDGTCLGAEIDLDPDSPDRQGICVLATPMIFDLEAVTD